MKVMVLNQAGHALQEEDRDIPKPHDYQVLLKVLACGVCRTDLHVVDGDLSQITTPIVPGHEIVGRIIQTGDQSILRVGVLVGIPWLGWTCGNCRYCTAGMENLCDNACFTGYQIDGGYGEYTLADSRYCIPLDSDIDPIKTAPLLCAGLIGYRAYAMAIAQSRQPVEHIGLYGFGAAAHILAQVIRHHHQQFYAFTRPKDIAAQQLALKLGASWVGSSEDQAPVLLDTALIFAPVGSLVPTALRAVRKAGSVICAGIHMSTIPAFSYEILWSEKKLLSVANLTREDGAAFMEIAKQAKIETHVTQYPLLKANQALSDLRSGQLNGAAVLVME